MRILVCGGRDFTNIELFRQTMDSLNLERPVELICGMARGADLMAWKWAKLLDLTVHEFPAEWDSHGKAAGFIRNQEMIDEGKPDLVIAFPGGKGTADMVSRAKKHSIEVIEI